MTAYYSYGKLKQADLDLMLSNDYLLSDTTQKMLLRQWYCDLTDANDDPKIAVTITLKQRIQRPDKSHIRLDQDEIKRVIRHLHHRVNREVFGAAARKYRKRVFLLPAIEGGEETGKRLHIHLVLGIPRHYDRDHFLEWLRQYLSKEPWVYEQVNLTPIIGKQFWHWYITKQHIELELVDKGR